MNETKTHFKKLYNPNYFGSYCFEDGKDMVLTIKKMVREVVKGEGGKSEECTVMYFKEDVKPFICNITNCKTISKLFNTPFIENWSNRKIQLYADSNIRFGKDIVEGVRVRPFPPKITETVIKCTDCGSEIKAFGKMSAQQVATDTTKKYGAALCVECATKRKEQAQQGNDVLGDANAE